MRLYQIYFGMLLAAGVASPLLAQTDQVRFGNLHAHTSYSDGRGTPADAFTMACAQDGIDFFAVTEHNHDAGDGKGDRRDGLMIATRPDLYRGTFESLVETADRLNRPGSCVTIYGQEFSTISKGNHVNIFDVDSIIAVGNGEYGNLLAWLAAHPDLGGSPALLQFNHPRTGRKAAADYGRDDFGGDDNLWVQAMAPHVSLIEVLNAPALQRGEHQRAHDRVSLYFRYLNLGFHLAPSVGQDNHYENWGISTDARVAVITPDFARRGILSALRARHSYATEDRNLRVVFRSGNALQGDIVLPPAVGTELPLTVQIVDDDEPDATYRIDVYKDVAGGKAASAPVESYEVTGNQVTPLLLEGIFFETPGEYVLLRVTQLGEEDDEHPLDDRAWTAPIWFEAGGHHQIELAPKLRVVQLIPDPVGDDVVAEQITFRNTGTTMINLTGWKVRDLAGNVWSLDGLGQLAAGQSVVLRREGQEMSLNNGGDEVELVAPEGTVTQTVIYSRVTSGQVITPGGN